MKPLTPEQIDSLLNDLGLNVCQKFAINVLLEQMLTAHTQQQAEPCPECGAKTNHDGLCITCHERKRRQQAEEEE